MTAKHVETIQKLIKSSPVFVASKSYCPFCTQTKRTLGALGAKSKIIELDHENDGAELQQALQSITNMRTVPQVFIGGQFIGGNSELQAVESSKLQDMLKQAKL